MTVSLLETCKECGGTGSPDDLHISRCVDCNGDGVVFSGFADDRPTLVARQVLHYLITDNTVSSSVERMSKDLMQELEDYELDRLAEQADGLD